MTAYTRLTHPYEDYLLRLYFGRELTLSVCVKRAYLDFCRTLHGISKDPNRDQLHSNAVNHLTAAFADLKSKLTRAIDQKTFDGWHQNTCATLSSLYNGHRFHAGQAQKWVNMTLKYIYTLGEEHVSGFQQAYPLCHVPLDKIVLHQLAKYGFPEFSLPWSRVDYDQYFHCQEWIRSKFATLAPLDLEFWLWMDKEPPGLSAAAGSR
jgi:hypothetical protein